MRQRQFLLDANPVFVITDVILKCYYIKKIYCLVLLDLVLLVNTELQCDYVSFCNTDERIRCVDETPVHYHFVLLFTTP